MGRGKNKRVLHFKPLCKEFAPKQCTPSGFVEILEEEIEAIYLMDIANLYQEEAALKMEISRPTFTRILKSARTKITNALISGYEIKIEDNRTCYKVAVCADEEGSFSDASPTCKNIYMYKVDEKGVELLEVIHNEASKVNRPTMLFPKLFLQKDINVFISAKMGDGLRCALVAKGIKPIFKKSFTRDELLDIVREL